MRLTHQCRGVLRARRGEDIRSLSQARRQQRDILQIEVEIRRDGRFEHPEAEDSGRREPHAEETIDRDDARRCDVEGPQFKKMVTPAG